MQRVGLLPITRNGVGLAHARGTVTRLSENWQWAVVLLWTGCSPMVTPPPVDAGARLDAGVVVDAGLLQPDAGSTDAGVDAGIVVPLGWGRTANAPGTVGLWGTVLAFDPVDRRFILHGGNRAPMGSVQNETWSFSIANATWTKLTTNGAMMPYRYCHCTTYLPAQRQVLVTGGRNTNTTVDSAFTLDLQTLEWTEIAGTVPNGGIGCNAHWVPAINRAIVFGGDGSGGVNNRTWSYDPVARAFTELMPTTRPPARRDAMSIFEPMTGRVMLFGGATQIMQSYLDDVATFDGTSWTLPMMLGTRPTPRRYGATGFDAVNRRWLIFGGTNDADDFDDTWVVNPTTLAFERQALMGGPSRRGFSASGIDELTGTLYIFGGLSASTFASNTEGWTLRLPP